MIQNDGDVAASSDWFRNFELDDGRTIDLGDCRPVHWYYRKSATNVWEPYPDDERYVAVRVCRYAIQVQMSQLSCRVDLSLSS